MSGAHEVVINHMGEVICRNSRLLYDYYVLEIIRHGKLTSNGINDSMPRSVLCGEVRSSAGFESDYKRVSVFDAAFYLLAE